MGLAGQEGPAPRLPARGSRHGHAQRRGVPAGTLSLRVAQERAGVPLARRLPRPRALGPRGLRGVPVVALRGPPAVLHPAEPLGQGADRPYRHPARRPDAGGAEHSRALLLSPLDRPLPRARSGRAAGRKQRVQPDLPRPRPSAARRGSQGAPPRPERLLSPPDPAPHPLRHPTGPAHGSPPLRPRRLPPVHSPRGAPQRPPRSRRLAGRKHRLLPTPLRPLRVLEVCSLKAVSYLLSAISLLPEWRAPLQSRALVWIETFSPYGRAMHVFG